MDLFDNSDPEEFLLFVCNFNKNLEASRALLPAAKAQYHRTLLRFEALRQFDLLSAEVESAKPLTTEDIILGLGVYFPPVRLLSKQKHAMRRGMRNPSGLK